MVLYLMIILLSTTIALTDMGNNSRRLVVRNKKVLLSALGLYVFLFVLTAFRDKTIGNDTMAYLDIYNRVNNEMSIFQSSTRIEAGFRVYCYLLGRVSSNPHILLIVSAIICYGITGYFILSCTERHGIILAFLIPLMFKNFCSGLRQDLAFCICLLAYILIKKEKYLTGGILIVFASTFHITALISLLYFIIPFLERNSKHIFSFLVVFVIGAILAYYLGILNFFNQNGSYYERYYNEVGRAKIGVLSCLLTLAKSVVALITYYRINKVTTVDDCKSLKRDYVFWFSIVLIVIAIMNFFTNNIARLMWYFELPFLLQTVNCSEGISARARQRYLMPLILIYQTIFIVGLVFRPYYYLIYPYHFWGN